MQAQQTPVAPRTGLLLLTLSRGLESPGAKAPAPGEAALCSTPVWLELNQPWRAEGINPLKAGAVKWESQNSGFVWRAAYPSACGKIAFKAPGDMPAPLTAARDRGRCASC